LRRCQDRRTTPRAGSPPRPPGAIPAAVPGALSSGDGGAGTRVQRYIAAAVDLRRLRKGEWIRGGSGLLLLIALFLPWYEIGAGAVVGPPDALDAHASACDALTVLDALLHILARAD